MKQGLSEKQRGDRTKIYAEEIPKRKSLPQSGKRMLRFLDSPRGAERRSSRIGKVIKAQKEGLN